MKQKPYFFNYFTENYQRKFSQNLFEYFFGNVIFHQILVEKIQFTIQIKTKLLLLTYKVTFEGCFGNL